MEKYSLKSAVHNNNEEQNKMNSDTRVRYARLKKGLTQQELADKLNVTKQTVYKYENGLVKTIPYDIVMKMGEILDTNPAYLMGFENNDCRKTVGVDDDLGEMLNFALRYAIGRGTYSSMSVPAYITPLIPNLTNRTLVVMARDIVARKNEPFAGDEPYGDPEIDKPAWIKLLVDIREELRKRGINE